MGDFRCRAEISLSALSANFLELKRKNKNIIAVVKADAYGHGSVRVAAQLCKDGCNRFAVASAEEGARLRTGGVCGELIVLGYVPEGRIDTLNKYGLSPTVYDTSSYERLILSGFSGGCYLKINTGMNRLGLSPVDAAPIRWLGEGRLDFRGVFTHLSSADEGDAAAKEYTERQVECFKGTAERLNVAAGKPLEYVAANSAAALTGVAPFDGVRAGIALYGVNPSGHDDDNLKPVMSVKSVISGVRELKKGDFVGYGRTFSAKHGMRVAVVAMGYADGYPRALSNVGYIVANGCTAPVIGRVSMDMLTVDISGISADVGDEVIVLGQGVSACTLARLSNTIPYEILCGISKRVPRIYIGG